MSVQSIERAFAILRVVAQSPNGVGITDLAEHTQLHKSTVSRLVSTLEEQGILARLPNSTDVCIGAGLMALITPQSEQQHLLQTARPFLARLCQQLNEAVGLCVPDGDSALFLEQVNSRQAVQVRNWSGERYPLHLAAGGKIFLAYASEKARERYLSRPLSQFTPYSLTDATALRQNLQQIVNVGYNWAWEEFEEGLVTVAAPIFDWRNVVIGAVYACGPRYRFPANNQQERITHALLATCLQIAQELPR
jgi:DNA-binding IclR family transcriptional regulator